MSPGRADDGPLRTCGLLLMLGISLVGCSSMAPPAVENTIWTVQQHRLQALDSWQLRGRVNVRYYDQSHTPRMLWQQNGSSFSLRLWGTFNTGNTVIEGQPGAVTLRQGDTTVRADSPEQLILQQLGYELPVSRLQYWIRGLAEPAMAAEYEFSETNHPARLRQDGWVIDYSDLRQYGELSLPRQVEVSRPSDDVRLRFVGLNWSLDFTGK